MIILLIKKALEQIKIKFFKHGQVGVRDVVIIVISLAAGFLVLYLVIKMFYVSRTK